MTDGEAIARYVLMADGWQWAGKSLIEAGRVSEVSGRRWGMDGRTVTAYPTDMTAYEVRFAVHRIAVEEGRSMRCVRRSIRRVKSDPQCLRPTLVQLVKLWFCSPQYPIPRFIERRA